MHKTAAGVAVDQRKVVMRGDCKHVADQVDCRPQPIDAVEPVDGKGCVAARDRVLLAPDPLLYLLREGSQLVRVEGGQVCEPIAGDQLLLIKAVEPAHRRRVVQLPASRRWVGCRIVGVRGSMPGCSTGGDCMALHAAAPPEGVIQHAPPRQDVKMVWMLP